MQLVIYSHKWLFSATTVAAYNQLNPCVISNEACDLKYTYGMLTSLHKIHSGNRSYKDPGLFPFIYLK